MPNLVETFLRNARAERIRQQKARIPQGHPQIPKGLELKYAVQLRNYQRAINKEYLDILEPIIASYRQDATTEEIETAIEKTQEIVNAAILSGAILNGIVSTQGLDITKWNNNRYNKPLYNIIGMNNIPVEQTNAMLESWTQENIKLIKGVNDDQVRKIEPLLLRAEREGLQPGDLTKEIRKIMKSSLSRATLIARDQTLKLNGQIDKVKQTSAGIDEYIWRTSRDERVRPEHRAREGKKFSWDDPPPDGHPGQAINCRCSAEPYLEKLLGPEYKPEGPRTIKEPLPKKPKPKVTKPAPKVEPKPKELPKTAPIPPKPKELPKTKLQPEKPISVRGTIARTPPTPPTPNVNKPAKRDVIVSGRARKRSTLTPKQQDFDQNAQWIKQNPYKNRRQATVGERSKWLHWEWVHGSNRKASVSMKQAAKKAFNLRGTVFNPHGLNLDLVDDLMVKDIRAIHKATQGQLAQKGIKKIKLYRGINTLYTEPGAIESWTSDPAIARRFGKYVMEQEFDVSRILDYRGSVNWTDGIWGNQSEYMVMR